MIKSLDWMFFVPLKKAVELKHFHIHHYNSYNVLPKFLDFTIRMQLSRLLQ